MVAKKSQTASLVHQLITTSHGGPHVGSDTFSKTIQTSAPVVLDARGRAQLLCELEGCGLIFNVQLLTTKERWKPVLIKALVVTTIMAAASFMAQSGTWVYDAGDNSQALRILGSTLTGAGVAINFLVILWTLMSFWFWPRRYRLEHITPPAQPGDTPTQARLSKKRRQYSDVRSGHSVKLRKVKL